MTPSERVLYRQPAGPNPLHHRDYFSRPALRLPPSTCHPLAPLHPTPVTPSDTHFHHPTPVIPSRSFTLHLSSPAILHSEPACLNPHRYPQPLLWASCAGPFIDTFPPPYTCHSLKFCILNPKRNPQPLLWAAWAGRLHSPSPLQPRSITRLYLTPVITPIHLTPGIPLRPSTLHLSSPAVLHPEPARLNPRRYPQPLLWAAWAGRLHALTPLHPTPVIPSRPSSSLHLSSSRSILHLTSLHIHISTTLHLTSPAVLKLKMLPAAAAMGRVGRPPPRPHAPPRALRGAV